MTCNDQYADPICKECKEQIFPYIEDNTQAFDCGSRLKGPEDIKVFPACGEFPEGCEPDKCSREVITTADELNNMLIQAKKTHLNFKNQEKYPGQFDFLLIDLELLIAKIEEKLEES